jgi:hypothetical protein
MAEDPHCHPRMHVERCQEGGAGMPHVMNRDGPDTRFGAAQASMIRSYIIWRSNHAHHERLRRIIDRATLPDAALGTN